MLVINNLSNPSLQALNELLKLVVSHCFESPFNLRFHNSKIHSMKDVDGNDSANKKHASLYLMTQLINDLKLNSYFVGSASKCCMTEILISNVDEQFDKHISFFIIKSLNS